MNREKKAFLLIESENLACDVLQRIICHAFPGMHCDVVQSPEDASRLMDKTKYRLVICDAHLALESRMAFIYEICRKESGTNLVVITGLSELTKEEFPDQTCIFEIIKKPVEIETLISTLNRALAQKE